MNTPDISFVEVGSHTDPEQLKGFIHVYQQAFNEPPYEEPYEKTGNTVENVTQHVWDPHLRDGCIVLALHDNQVVGLGCSVPINLWSHDKGFQEFITQEAAKLPDAIPQICFMSEVCVLREFRRRGIGSRLVLDRVAWAKTKGFSHYMMRTAEEGSNSKGMYLKLGAWQVPNLIQDVSNHADEVGSASKRRIFLAGKVE